jgi:hypothetical protein
MLSSPALARSVYLNGVDISSARNQELKNVAITINEHGDVFISGPQYQIQEQDSYIPLSAVVSQPAAKTAGIEHKAPTEITKSQAESMLPPSSAPAEAGELKELSAKAGEPLEPTEPATAPVAILEKPGDEKVDAKEKAN